MSRKDKSKKLILIGAGVFLAVGVIAGSAWWWQNSQFSPNIVAIADGQEVTELETMKIIGGMGKFGEKKFSDLAEQERIAVVREIVAQKKILDLAKKHTIDQNPDVKQRIQDFTETLMREAFLMQTAVGSISEEAIKKHYQTLSDDLKGKEEIHVRHILVKSEKEARDVLKALESKEFAEVARAHSLDAASAPNGGDLGYIIAGKMVESFDKAVNNLKKGKVSEPVQTPFGWHIIKMEDRRDAKPAPYERVKERIRQDLAQRNVRVYIENLVKDVKIELK
jgi:peptidyl-prolyl cis-trans isomerase C